MKSDDNVDEDDLISERDIKEKRSYKNDTKETV